MILTFSKYLFPLACSNYCLSLSRALKDGKYVLTLLVINSAEGCVDPVEILLGMRGKERAHRDNAASPLPTGADSARLQHAKRLEPCKQAVLPQTIDLLLPFSLPLQSFQSQRNLYHATDRNRFLHLYRTGDKGRCTLSSLPLR